MTTNVRSAAFGPGDRCPACGSERLQSWADDGEADLADWWECSQCGEGGAVLDDTDPARTQNGILLATTLEAAP